MTEHLSPDEIEQYRRGSASPASLLSLDDHLALCAACRARAAETGDADELLSSLRSGLTASGAEASGHLTPLMIAAYADGSLGEADREVTENHLSVCRSCEREARELLDFKTAVSSHLDERYDPAPAQPSSPRPRKNLLSFLTPRALIGSPWRAAMAAAVVILAIGSAWLIWRLSSNEVAEVAKGPAASPTAPAVVNDGGRETDAGNNSRPDTSPTQTPEEGATDILLALNDGRGRVTLDAEGNLAGVESLAPAQVEAVKAALRTERAVNPAALAGVGARAVVWRGGGQQPGQAFLVRGPAGLVVEGARPTLRWDALADATYTVTIYDSNFNAVATSPTLTSPSWTPPRPLARGQIYSWQVTAEKQGVEIKTPQPPAPEAKFKVLEGARAAEIQRARRANPDSHLALGVLYAQAGLLDDAEREFGALVRANPKSEVARKLLNDVRQAKVRQK